MNTKYIKVCTISLLALFVTIVFFALLYPILFRIVCEGYNVDSSELVSTIAFFAALGIAVTAYLLARVHSDEKSRNKENLDKTIVGSTEN